MPRPRFLTDELLNEWIDRGEKALEYHKYRRGWAKAYATTFVDYWDKSEENDSSSMYLEMVYYATDDLAIDGPNSLTLWRVESMFWEHAIEYHGNNSHRKNINEVLIMAQDFDLNEWGV